MAEKRIEVVVHHGGTMITQYPINYINGDIVYWDVDLDKWSYFEIIGALKDFGYLHVKQLFYSIDNVLHEVYDDKGAMNMLGVGKCVGKVDLYVVHGVDHAEVVENNEPEVGVQLLLTQGELVNESDKSEEESGGNEVDGGLQVEESGGNEEDGGVQEEIVVETQVENEVESEYGLNNEVEVESDGGGDNEVEVESEDEGHMDHLSGDEYVEEEEEEEMGFGLEDSDEECRVEVNCRGLSDDEWHSDVLVSPENSDSENESEDRPQPGAFQTYEKQKSMTNYKWEVGTVFADKAHFIEAIRTYVVHTGRALKFVKNDKRRVRVRCMGGQGKCPWTAYCGYLPTRQFWQLRKIKDTHSCSRQLNIKILNTKWLSEEIDRSLQDNPNLKVQDIRQKALRKWNTKISISKARRAKLMATRQLIGDFKEQYKRIHDYGHELLRSNPGSTVKVEVDSVNGETVFKRFYVCLKGCKESFVSCRRIICLDGCFLKGQYKGELLTAIGRDPNDQMLPLAYAIVEVENKETWSWFLQLLIGDLGGNEVCGRCTWMSDQQKGLVHAIEELLPKADQRFCMRHLYANFRKQFPGQTLRTLMWKAATSTYPQAWEREMLNIKQVNIEAYKYLISIPPRYWSRSRFTYEAVCDSLDNNICEAFNSVIVLARGKPIITMLEEIRLYLMKRWATNRTKVAAMKFTICPKINTRLIKESNLSRYWIPSWSGRKLFEVRHTAVITNKFTVDLETKECSCRKWMISGIPCCHAIAAMNYCNEDPKNFIPSCFTRTTYEATYAPMIYPVNGQLLWEKTSFVDVLPPVIRKMPGRPKKKRKLEAWELTKDATQMNIGGHRKKCTICRKLGHNRSKCPLRPPITEPTCPSNSQTQQANPQSPQPPQPTQESSAHSTPPIMRKKLPFKRRIN